MALFPANPSAVVAVIVRVLGARKDDLFSYTTQGTNRAYAQYRQPVPKVFERLRFWPVEVFNEQLPPRFRSPTGARATGDQQTWGTVRMAIFAGSTQQFFTGYFADGATTIKVSAR